MAVCLGDEVPRMPVHQISVVMLSFFAVGRWDNLVLCYSEGSLLLLDADPLLQIVGNAGPQHFRLHLEQTPNMKLAQI